MSLPHTFINIALENRLGQTVELAVNHVQSFGRDFVFVAALTHQASSLVAKNAEHFAFQLREYFDLDARRFEMIELRGNLATPELWRWKFEWVGSSPLTPKCELIIAETLQTQFLNLINIPKEPKVALG
ncbi:MAG: hypothetical protein EOO68_29525 [Moraxellaceae bacterium]|nr:MAG: hypothetical protein EOO68_29525 [Moraxellaceae bacterium]